MGAVNATVMGLAAQCCAAGALDQGQSQRLELLRKGAKFTRSVMLGMMQQELWVRLGEDDSAIVWRTMNSSSTDSGTIDIKDIHKAKANGEMGLTLAGVGSKVLLEVSAEDAATRDKWVVALSELLERVNAPSSDHMNRQSCAVPASDRAYWRDREKEVEANQQRAEEKKKKYASAGMKYTAEAMMRQGK